MNEKKKKRSSFSGQIGFIIAAAASAVGCGNIWRFPYLAARDGGGVFIVVYLVLLLTFGFALLTSDIGLGRKTKKSAIYAYDDTKKGWKFLGILVFIVPGIIMTYYSVIGGWVLKYVAVYFTGQGQAAAEDGYFSSFITSPGPDVICGLIFMLVTAVIVYKGVEKGIERYSKILMPALLVLIVVVVIFSMTIKHTDDAGVTRTGLEGLKVYLVPDFTGMTVKRFLQILLDACMQLYFSLSVSMGIMITYGSYVDDKVDLNKSITHIEIFDTVVALLAGAMVIPAIYAFSGTEGMSQGPGLVFISLPKVFASMGKIGIVVGAAFFVMFTFAALTSSVSVLEAVVSNLMEIFGTRRKPTALAAGIFYCVATAVVALGYSWFYFEVKLPNGSEGQLLDIMDYISNSVMMPLVTFLTSILIGWVVGPKYITDEIQKNGEKFRRKQIFIVMIKYVVPVVMLILLLQALGVFNNLKF